MTRCTATGALFDGDMQIIPGITLQCELEAGHDDARALYERGYLHEPIDHAFTFRWGNPSVDELAEVLDPDESFDLEVDIAPASAIRQQQRNSEANLDDGRRPDLSLDTGELETIPDARVRCTECGREVEADAHSTNGYRHLVRPAVLHAARVA